MKIEKLLQRGYYIFLGNGDYHQPENLTLNWTSRWGLNEWKNFIEKIAKLHANTLMIYLNGHYLPYRSTRYPELIQLNHPNVQDEFFSKVMSIAKDYNLNLIAVLSTTGHAGKYSEDHPQLEIKVRSKDIDFNKLLSSFPEHIRKKKHTKQDGNAQVGRGILCHNNAMNQYFSINLIEECLTLYKGFDGIALHPPESIYPCFCDCCSNLFKEKYGKELSNVSDDVAREFYLETYLDFQGVLENKIKELMSRVQLYTFTIPWLFEPSFEKIAMRIAKDTTIIDWDYNLNLERINQLKQRITRYQKFNHTLWFMPTAGFGFDDSYPIQYQIDKLQKQMVEAVDSGIGGMIQFIGPRLVCALEKTSFFNKKPHAEEYVKCKL